MDLNFDMPFNKADIYISSGSVQLFNEWVHVSKFDTSLSQLGAGQPSSLPRGAYLRALGAERLQHFSGVPGLALTVSADADAAHWLQQVHLHPRVPTAAIPKVVRFPVLVEVGSFGDLGDLELYTLELKKVGLLKSLTETSQRCTMFLVERELD